MYTYPSVRLCYAWDAVRRRKCEGGKALHGVTGQEHMLESAGVAADGEVSIRGRDSLGCMGSYYISHAGHAK